jgi:hypothetical protein
LKNRLISAILNGIYDLCWSFPDIVGFCWSFWPLLDDACLFWPFLAFAGLCLPLPAIAGTMERWRDNLQQPAMTIGLFGLFGFF